MKTVITVEPLDNYEFNITIDDDVATTHIKTTSPQKVVVEALHHAGLIGKRGRRIGYKNKTVVGLDAAPLSTLVQG